MIAKTGAPLSYPEIRRWGKIKMIDKTYDVGIYCRLSNDDERDGESVSIENQKLLLQNYVRQRGWNEVDVYIEM